MAESQEQYAAITYAVYALKTHVGDGHLVAGDFLLYYEEGNSSRNVAPDVMLACDVGRPPATPYKLWEVGRPPALVMEVASPSTHRRRDSRENPDLYATLGIAEYWQYDPHGQLLVPCLQGWTLQAGAYVPIHARYRTDATVCGSEVLDTEWGLLDTGELRLWKPETEAWILPYGDERSRRRQAASRAAAAESRATAAKFRAAAAAAELARLRAQLGHTP